MLQQRPDDGGWVGVFVRRPILALVLNLLIIIAGIAAYQGIEVRELPDVDRPVVTVRATYAGATPESIDSQITAVIESAVSRVQGVTSISSNSSYGSARISIEFSSSTNLDTAAMDVRDAVAGIVNQLPKDMEDEPRVVKADADATPIMQMSVSAAKLSEGELTDLVNNVIEDKLASVEGVAAANSYGLRAKTIEVRVNQTALAGRGISLADLTSAIGKAAVTAPSGALENATQQLLVRAEAPVATPEDVGNLEINAQTKVKDVAFVRWGFQEATAITRLDGKTAIGIDIIRQAQANTIDISEGVHAAVDELRKTLPAGVDISITRDDAVFIRESVREVIISLAAGERHRHPHHPRLLALVPRHHRAGDLHSGVADRHAGRHLGGRLLDQRHHAAGARRGDGPRRRRRHRRHREHRPPPGHGRRAARRRRSRHQGDRVRRAGDDGNARRRVHPRLVHAGPRRQPVLRVRLRARLLGQHLRRRGAHRLPDAGLEVRHRRGGARRQAACMGRVGNGLTNLYMGIVEACLRLRWIVVAICLGFGVLGFIAFQTLKQEITPAEDRGVIQIRLTAQQGANLDYMSKLTARVEEVLAPYKQSGEVTNVLSSVGNGGANRAMVIVSLADWHHRERTQQQIQAELQKKLDNIAGLQISLLGANSLGIRGGGQGLRFAIVGPSYERLSATALKMVNKLQELPDFRSVRTDYDTTQPQLSVRINREASTKLGVPIETITSLINAMIDYQKAADLFIEDDIVEIQVKAGGRPINDPSDLQNLFVKAADGKFITLSSLVTIKEVAIAPTLGREDRQRSVGITANLNDGVVLGDAVEEMRGVAATTLDPDMSITLLGEARTLAETTQNTTFVFAIAFLVVFLVLAAQFESLTSALVIMCTVPFGLACAAIAIMLTGGTLNVYSQIGLVLLVGVMAKNGILIVEFANIRRDEGASVDSAIREACRTRLRPVMMTMAAAVLGAVPLIFASGAGAEARLALGWIIVGGLGLATIFTLLLTPVAYRILAPLSKPRAAETQKLIDELKAAPRHTGHA